MPGHVIRHFREQKNYSQKYVSSRMGISQNAYSKIENNLTQLTIHHVKQLSAILDVPITDLLKDDFEVHKPFVLQSKTATKDELLKYLELLKQKIQTKHAVRHDSYMVSLSLLHTIDNMVAHVY
jgi:transcriptional regulator with XRE-family HTH domain